MQKHVNLVDLVKSFPRSIYLQKLASIQQRTSLSKFVYFSHSYPAQGYNFHIGTSPERRRGAGRQVDGEASEPASHELPGGEGEGLEEGRWRAGRDLKLAYMVRVVKFLNAPTRSGQYTHPCDGPGQRTWDLLTRSRVRPCTRDESVDPRDRDPAKLAGFTQQDAEGMPAREVYARWCAWVEAIAARVGVRLADESRSGASRFSEGYCESIGAAFEREASTAPSPEARSFARQVLALERQVLLCWLGICIREESLEKFERFVLSSYRAVSAGQGGNLSDEIRVSLLRGQVFCSEAPLLGFICETDFFGRELGPSAMIKCSIFSERRLFSASAIPMSSSARVLSSRPTQGRDVPATSSRTGASRSTPAALVNVGMPVHLTGAGWRLGGRGGSVGCMQG